MKNRVSPWRVAKRRARSYHHGNLRQALVDASLAIIESEGLPSLTLRKAARAAGVSHAAPAHHFGDLRGLLAAVAEEGHRRLLGEIQAAMADLEPSELLDRLRLVGLVYVGFATANPSHFRAMYHPALADKSKLPDLRTASQATFDILVDTIEACQRAGQVRAEDPRQLGLLAWSAVHGLAVLLIDDQLHGKGLPSDAEPLAEQMTANVFLGLRPAGD